VAVDIGYRVIEGRALTALADLQLANDRSDQAIDYAERALASHRRTGDRLGIARTLIVLGRAVKRPDAALPHWQEALELLAELGAPEAEQVRLLIQRAGGSTVLR
jgi:tetratricopeptide (TPR) repeat protein